MVFYFKQDKPLIALCVLVFLLAPVIVFGRVGVGVGMGKIQIDEPLRAGGIYSLPTLPVLNTGDEPGEYGVSIEYFEGQEARANMGQRPAKEWFRFEPELFHLEPGKVQTVKITLTLPTKAQPGKYFAYLEGHPVRKAEAGLTSIGIAAASKLYFTVAPSNIFQGIYYRVVSFWTMYAPWTWIILALIIGAAFITLFRKFFKFHIGIKINKK